MLCLNKYPFALFSDIHQKVGGFECDGDYNFLKPLPKHSLTLHFANKINPKNFFSHIKTSIHLLDDL